MPSGPIYLRLAVGEYRVIYRDDAETVHVVIDGKRNDGEVYRLLGRKPEGLRHLGLAAGRGGGRIVSNET